MKNNLRFIFPRLVAATVIVGVASFVLFTLFRILIGVMIIGGIVMLVRKMAGRNYREFGPAEYGRFANQGYGPLPTRNQWESPISVNANPSQKQTIVPIN